MEARTELALMFLFKPTISFFKHLPLCPMIFIGSGRDLMMNGVDGYINQLPHPMRRTSITEVHFIWSLKVPCG
jgi:hypothetical protein